VPENELMERLSDAPVVRLVNSIIEQATVSRASDIHIEPGCSRLRVRFTDRRQAAGNNERPHADTWAYGGSN
jgi:type II secretory ATPase GspE/PulE/Tfp pilus assembly ATPase PilB-like protein